ncbi:MAG: histidine phosphatase family protein [Candidatus Thermoplasmatota archaeon]|nr:histidine phosphatase family protein [Candidatus Thermoplasmatota archaeon]
MSRRLIIMRHAKSSWDDPSLGDHDRPLNPRGLRDAPIMADTIERIGWTPNLILVSSSMRTKQTLDLMSHVLSDADTEIREGIYHAGLNDLLHELQDIPDAGTTMILGHNPGSELLIKHLSGEWHSMPTAAAALLSESNGTWIVEKVLRPKEL